jgi:hypothetical protein
VQDIARTTTMASHPPPQLLGGRGITVLHDEYFERDRLKAEQNSLLVAMDVSQTSLQERRKKMTKLL